MTVWILPSLDDSSGVAGAACGMTAPALVARITSGTVGELLHCDGGALRLMGEPVPGAQRIAVLETAPDHLPDVAIVLGAPHLPPPLSRHPPLRVEHRPGTADAAQALWELSLMLHERRIGSGDGGGPDTSRPWISGLPVREAALALPDGRWIVLQDEMAVDPPRLIGPGVEIVTLAAENRAGLLAALADWRPGAPCPPATPRQRVRLGFVHRAGADAEKTRALGRKVIETAKGRVTHPSGLCFNPEAGREPVAFLFPGQGAQYRGMLRAALDAQPALRDWFDALDRHYPADLSPLPSRLLLEDWEDDSPSARAFHGLAGGGYASLTAALAHHDLLVDLGLRPDAILGHSNGENAALLAAGVIRTATRKGKFAVLSHMCGLFSNADASFGGDPAEAGGDGSICVALALPATMEAGVLDRVLDDEIVLMMDNCPSQKVVWGPAKLLEARLAPLREEGMLSIRLPLTAPYHTRHFRPVVDRFVADYMLLDLGPGQIPLYSGHTGAPFPENRGEIIETATRQWSEPVRFGRAIERMHADGIRVFVDVGPGGRLAGFVRDTLADRPHAALAVDEESRKDGSALPRMLVQGFCLGILDAVTGDRRGTRPQEAQHPDAGARTERPDPAIAQAVTGAAIPPKTALSTAPPPAAAGARNEGGWRAALAQAHFGLMRDHLAQEARIFAGLRDRLAGTASGAARRHAQAPAPDLLRPFGACRIELTEEGMIVELRMTPERQTFLRDHAFCKARSVDPGATGLTVLPLMLSAEIAAAAAVQRAGPGWHVIALEGLRGHRWIAGDTGGIDLQLDLRALTTTETGSRRYSVTLHHRNAQDDSGGGVAATCEIVLNRRPAPSPAPFPDALPPPPATYPDGTAMITGEGFAERLFHGPCFTSIGAVGGWSETGIEVAVTAPSETGFVAPDLSGPRVINGPLLDNAGQILALQQKHATTRSFGLFPVLVERIGFFGPRPEAGVPLRVVTRQVAGENTVTGDLDYRDASQRVVMRVEGMKMVFIHWPRRFEASFFRGRAGGSLAEPLEAPEGVTLRILRGFEGSFLTTSNRIWLRSLAWACLSAEERAAFHALPPRGPRQEEWLLGRIAVKEAGLCALSDPDAADLVELEVTQDEGGRPTLVLPDGARVPCSISHSNGTAAGAVAAPGWAIGLDVEPISGLDDPIGRNVLAFDPSERAALDRFGPKAVWCAKEAVAKAIGTGLMGAPTRFKAHLRGDALHVSVASVEIPVTFPRSESHHVALCHIPQSQAAEIAAHLTTSAQPRAEREAAHVDHSHHRP